MIQRQTSIALKIQEVEVLRMEEIPWINHPKQWTLYKKAGGKGAICDRRIAKREKGKVYKKVARSAIDVWFGDGGTDKNRRQSWRCEDFHWE